MTKSILSLIIAALMLLTASCKKKSNDDDTETGPKLIFKFRFDSTQQRLDNFGNTAVIPPGNAAQSPVFNSMSSHYIELAPSAFTQLGSGFVAYRNEETTAGGSNAIDFSKSKLAGNNEEFYSMNLSDVSPGTYNYLRVSLAYQNYVIKYAYNYNGTLYDNLSGALASFIGFNTYIKSFKVRDSLITLNANRAQGYWAFEYIPDGTGVGYPIIQGQAPAGATTVPNPIASTSAIPAGSCVVTGQFASPLTITGTETGDIVITVSLSTNNSFEWKENGSNNLYEPAAGDTVVDMGIRGLIPIIE